MGLKKDTPGAQGEAGATPEAEVQTPPVQKPKPASAPKAAAKPASGARSVVLLAVQRPLSDPFLGTLFTLTEPKQTEVKPGDWIDCQMKAGLLKEYTAPKGA